MKTKYCIFIVLLSTKLNAQKFNYELKLLNSTQYFNQKNSNSSHYQTQGKFLQILKLTPGISLQRGKNEMDFIITDFKFNKNNVKSTYLLDSNKIIDQNIKNNSFNFGLFIAPYVKLFKSKNDNVFYSFACILSSNYQSLTSSPEKSLKTKMTSFSLNGYVSPKVKFKIKENICFEINTPVQIFGTTETKNRVYNQQFSKSQQISSKVDATLLPIQMMVNFGFGFKI